MSCFSSFQVLIPDNRYLPHWPVIACDQFTSQPEYWKAVENSVGGNPSALRCILPECDLPGSTEERYRDIHFAMQKYLKGDIFRAYPDSYVYVERTMTDGKIRSGVVGVIDLEAYDYHINSRSAVRATEETVEERIPPRMKIRRNAPLEMSHVILLCDDPEDRLLSSLRDVREKMELLYDMELPAEGGHITGWLASGSWAAAFDKALDAYCEQKTRESSNAAPILFAVGDGNHSLGSAKAYYEELKAQLRDQKKNQSGEPAAAITEETVNRVRYAMVELENLHDPAQRIEPIHRLLTGVSPEKVLQFLEEHKAIISDQGTDPGAELTKEPITAPETDRKRNEVIWITGDRQGTMETSGRAHTFPIAALQELLDQYILQHGGTMDYIHDSEALRTLAAQPGAIGFRLPAIAREHLFDGLAQGGLLPRKTFSIGEAREKRYYMEARRL